MKNQFNVGDKVVQIGTTSPVMTIKGHPTYSSNIKNTDVTLYVCFWDGSDGPNWKNFKPDKLELFSTS